jgi:hypothetical protein
VHLRPVGPLPAATYWRRRLVVLLLLVALLAVGLWLAQRGDGDDRLATADPTADPTAQRSAEPTSSPSPTASARACRDDDLEVQATTDTADVAAGARATLTLTVRNTSAQACRRALGQGAVELVVTSGEDRIWSSDDCAPGGDDGVVLLEPGASQQARATWPGTRSAPGCPDGQPAALPGTYRITGRVGELQVPGMVFRVQE